MNDQERIQIKIWVYNICIEYDGAQHFEAIEYYGGEKKLKISKQRDEIKNKFCESENIYLFRINYKENINERLNLLYEILS